MKSTLLIALAAAIFTAGHTAAQELAPLGALPKLAADWEISDADRPPDSDAANPFRWIVFQNRRTSELLSLATHPDLGKNRKLEYLSDTSLEIFPLGHAVWVRPARDVTNNVISIKVVDADRANASLKGQQVLEYCFVSEAPDRENRMAHGRTWVGPKCVVFVQHTSAKPITSDFVDQIIAAIMRDQLTRGTGLQGLQPAF